MSPTLKKVSKAIRKDQRTSKSLDRLKKKLDKGLRSGRGNEKLENTKTVYYKRAGDKARLFYRYSPDERGVVEIIGEANKSREQEVIDNLRSNYK